MISIRKQRCLLHLHDMFGWRKVLCTGFLFRGRETEHGASWLACRKVISMSAGKGKHIKLAPRVPKPMQSHWEGRRGSGWWGPCRSRLLGASRGCSLRCWVLSAGCRSSSLGALGLVWLTPSRSSSKGDRSTWFWWRVVKILSLLPVWSSLASLGCTCGGLRSAGVVKAPCFLAG